MSLIETFEYTEVDISSAQLLALGTTAIQLLPAPGANNYYTGYIDFEFTYGTTQYSVVDQTGILIVYSSGVFQNDRISGLLSVALLLDNDNVIVSMPMNRFPADAGVVGGGAALDQPVLVPHVLNDQPLKIQSFQGSFAGTQNPTLGDGTLKAKIYYKVKSFG